MPPTCWATRSWSPDSDTRLQNYLLTSGERIVGINDTTRDDVRMALALGGERGYNQHQIAYGVDEDDFTGIHDIVDATYSRRADAIVRTELAFASASATLDTYDDSSVQQVEVSDGQGCGWTDHDDPDLADGSIRDMDDAQEYPIAHPNCVRVFLPPARHRVLGWQLHIGRAPSLLESTLGQAR